MRSLIAVLTVAFCSVPANARTWYVNQAKGDDHSAGTEQQPLKTISAAALQAQPGDIVLVSGGVYRERVAPARGGEPGRPITYMAAPGEDVIVRGSEQLQWTKQGDGSYKAALSDNIFDTINGTAGAPKYNPFTDYLQTSWAMGGCGDGVEGGSYTTGQIHADGIKLTQTVPNAPGAAVVGGNCVRHCLSGNCKKVHHSHSSSGCFSVVDNGTALLAGWPDSYKGAMPKNVEVTVRSRVFAPHIRGLKWIVVQGFQMEYAANQWIQGFWNLGSAARYSQSGLIGTRSGQNWVIRNNTIRYAQTIGVDIGIEGGYSGMGGDNEGSCCGGVDQPTPPVNETGNHTVDHNVFEHLGASSIVGYVSSGAITYNLVQNTGFQGCAGAENAAIKTHGFHGMFANNVLRYNTHGVSIWFDGGISGRVSRNVILVPAGEPGGIVFELGFNKVIVDNNILHGGGIGVQDASGINFVHNFVSGIGSSAVSLGGLTGRASDGHTSAMKSWWVEANMLLSPKSSAFMSMHKEKKGSDGEELMCNETVQHNLVTGLPASYPTEPGLNITVEPNQDVTGQLTVTVDTDAMTIMMTGGPSAGKSGCSANMPGGDIDFTGAKRGSTCAPGPFDWVPSAQSRNVSLWSAYKSM